MVVRILPKDETPVRFRYPAPAGCSAGVARVVRDDEVAGSNPVTPTRVEMCVVQKYNLPGRPAVQQDHPDQPTFHNLKNLMPISFYYALAAVIAVSLVSLTGAIYLLFKREQLSRFIPGLVAFAAGALLGAALFDLLPESIEALPEQFSIYLALGIVGFLIFEYVLHWHHHHHDNCEDCDHTTAYTVLVGDGLHNFIDGVIIASAFLVNPAIGVATTLAIILHEIPQELSDFAIFLHSGISTRRALFLNSLSAATAIAGTVIGYLFLERIEAALPYILSIGAGGFLYIAMVDLLAEVRRDHAGPHAGIKILLVLLGLGLIYSLGILLPEMH